MTKSEAQTLFDQLELFLTQGGIYAATDNTYRKSAKPITRVRNLPPCHISRSVSTISATIVHRKSRQHMATIASPRWVALHQQLVVIRRRLIPLPRKPTAEDVYAAMVKKLPPGHNSSSPAQFTHQLCSWGHNIIRWSLTVHIMSCHIGSLFYYIGGI